MELAQTSHNGRYSLWASFLASGIVALALVGAAAGQQPGSYGESSAESPLDAPIRLVNQARATYDTINDYACLFVKRERIRDQLQPENLIAMRVRTRPFSVDLRWLKPTDLNGQEACYIAGRNNGQMRVRSAGLLGGVGFVSLDTNDPRVIENSRHNINEAGIGNLIKRFQESYTMERSLNKTRVSVAEFDYNKRLHAVETVRPTAPIGSSLLPERRLLRSRAMFTSGGYDWPRRASEPGAKLSAIATPTKVDLGLLTYLVH